MKSGTKHTNALVVAECPIKYKLVKYPCMDRICSGAESVWLSDGYYTGPFRYGPSPDGVRGWRDKDWLIYTLWVMGEDDYDLFPNIETK